MGNKDILIMTDICKEFPGVKALDNVRFNLRSGEIHSLLGENGAGKSTLIKVLTGKDNTCLKSYSFIKQIIIQDYHCCHCLNNRNGTRKNTWIMTSTSL